MDGSSRIRNLRYGLGITMREVENYSRRIAQLEENDEFLVSTARLTQMENTNSIPSIYKLYSLSVIYRVNFIELISFYGLDLNRISKLQSQLPLQQTHVTEPTVYDNERLVAFPVRFDPGFSLERTALFSRMVQVWGEIPISLVQHIDLRKGIYGYIGFSDYTMYPILRPGSFVQIDDRSTTIKKPPWRSEFERPIYFIELRDEYVCSWCELQKKELFLLPHPFSGASIRRYRYPDEAEIVGQVTGVAMRIVSEPAVSTDTPRLQGKS